MNPERASKIYNLIFHAEELHRNHANKINQLLAQIREEIWAENRKNNEKINNPNFLKVELIGE
jgi:hypothetical protein